MKNNRKALLSIKGIMFITLALVTVGVTINLFYCGENTQLAVTEVETEIEEQAETQIQEDEELIVVQTASVANGAEVTSRGQATIRTEEVVEEPVVEEPQVQYKTIDQVTISKDMDLTVRTGLSKEGFKELISTVKEDSSKFFYENSDTIYDLCEKYELNEIFFCGLISAESGWNIAQNHRNAHNYISLMVNGKLIRYNSVGEGLEAAVKALHNNYLTPGGRFYYGKTLSAVKTKFCPASSTWVDLVYGRMKQIRY